MALTTLSPRLDRAWRLFGTGLGFACFGLGAIVISLSLFPAIRLVFWNRDACRRHTQRAMSRVMGLFVGLMKSLGVMSCELHGAERLRIPGQLVVANHPSLIDVVILIALMPEADCIVKQALWRNPFLRWPVSWAGYVPNDQPERLIELCVARLRAGHSLIVFPEGTRSVPGEPMQLRRGAAQIALAAGCEICPVRIEVSPLTLTKSDPWYRTPLRRPHWRVEVGESFSPADVVGTGVPTPRAARQLTRHFQALLSRPLLPQPRPV